eukprot:COSAG01_NODE_215_length_21709_cov_141.101217_23_plen_98_part_00
MVGNVKGVVAKGGASLEQVFQFLDSSGDNQVSHNGQLLSRRGCSSPASASGLDTHRDSISMPFRLPQLDFVEFFLNTSPTTVKPGGATGSRAKTQRY